MIIDYILLGVKYGLMAATTVGVFAACVVLLTPIVLIAANVISAILSIGGKDNG